MSRTGFPELVVLYGPASSGKTGYFQHALSGSHIRVSAEEFFRTRQGCGLHIVVKHVLKLLASGKNVLIDDPNLHTSERKAFLDAVQNARVKGQSALYYVRYVLYLAVRTVCVHVVPTGGRLQCLWQREWRKLCLPPEVLSLNDRDLGPYFDFPERPSTLEVCSGSGTCGYPLSSPPQLRHGFHKGRNRTSHTALWLGSRGPRAYGRGGTKNLSWVRQKWRGLASASWRVRRRRI